MLSACLRFAVLLRRSCAHPPLPQHTCRCPVFVPCVPSPVYIVLRLHTLCTYCAYSLYISSTHPMPGCTAAAPCWTRRVPGHASSVHISLPGAGTLARRLVHYRSPPTRRAYPLLILHTFSCASLSSCSRMCIALLLPSHAASSPILLHAPAKSPENLASFFLSRGCVFATIPSLYLSSCSIPCC